MKTFLKRFTALLGGLVILLLLFHLVENWRGKRAWEQWKQRRAALGDTLDPTPLIPPEVPDADNFATASRIAEAAAPMTPNNEGPSVPPLPAAFSNGGAFGNWRMGQKIDLQALKTDAQLGDLTEILDPWEPELAALAKAARRPHCRLAKDYRDTTAIPALLGMRARARALTLRALMALDEKKNDAALEDVLTGLRVVAHLRNEPHLLSQLLRTAYVNILMQPIWEGLIGHRWNDTQLQVLQAAMSSADLVESWPRAWRFERYLGSESILDPSKGLCGSQPQSRTFLDYFKPEALKSMLWSSVTPKGWAYQQLLRHDQGYVLLCQDIFDPQQHRIHSRANDQAIARLKQTPRGPYTSLPLNTVLSISDQNLRVARAQSGLDLAVIACALERHRLENGRYPKTLAALVPAYLPKAPVDVVEGQNLRYAPGREGFTLYSLGWNLTDEGGQVAPKGSENQGDWVWSKGH